MKRIVSLHWLPLFTAFLLALALPAHSGVIISEFMANNARTLVDEDGEFSDWLELHNPDAAPVDLTGWFLTDSATVLNKWAFPPVTLQPGGFLVVFASAKNRTNDPVRLHTSFKLNSAGGYLALVRPDGSTLASAFNPYPAMKEDVAFGLAQGISATSLLAGSAPRVLVPTAEPDLSPAWNLPGFAPGAGWLTGIAPPAMGFDTNRANNTPANVATSGTAVQSTVNSTFTANLAINGNRNDFTHTLGTDTSPFWQVTLTNELSIFSVVLFNRSDCCGSRLRDITVEILSTNIDGFVTNWTSTLLNPENAGFTYPAGPAFLSNNLVVATGGPVSGRIVRVRRTVDGDLSGSGNQGNADEANVLSLGEVVINAAAASGLRSFFSTDLEAPMLNQTPTAFARMLFTATNTPDSLTLNVRYDDGFVAYLNGAKIAERNAPVSPAWNAAATADRNFASAAAVESINISSAIPSLVNGTNLLAVQILNSSAASPDLLFQPDLSAARIVTTSNVFFTDATPGSANATGWYYDEVSDTHFSVDRGFFEAPFSLSITSGTPDAVIYYSINGDEPGPGKGVLYTGPLTITNTTVIRTRAFKDGWKATDVDSASYLFLGDVIYQARDWGTGTNRVPPPNFPASWGRNTVDYGMDPNVVTNYTLAQWKEALTQIPTMSVVTEMKNLFDASTGIYANADGHGDVWERPISLELLDPTNSVPGRFHENCGLRIRGGASRGTGFIKHSFRLFFRREYGAGKLKYPLFEDEGAQEFEGFDLRTSQNYSWPRNDNSTFDTMVREVWCRQTLGTMGQPYRRSRYYHLYLNGQYWGLYETDERPDASYGETYFGGSKTNYDVIKCGNRSVTPNFSTEATDGNLLAWSNLWVMTQMMLTNSSNENYFRPLGRNADGTRNPALPVMIDVDNLIDYMMGIFYSGDGDAPLSSFLSNNQANNWFSMRDRSNPDFGFRFFNNDCEHTLGSPNSQVDRTGPFPGSNEGIFIWSNPQWMHEHLMRNAEYRVRFGDHVQKHFFNNGALTFENCTNRFMAKALQINKAIRAYSARWGDGVVEPPYGEKDWTNAINFVLNWFIPRGNIVLAQLRADNLFPPVGAPAFSQFGGDVDPGYALEMLQTNLNGVLYFTTDGADPRALGGVVGNSAQAYSSAVIINSPTTVRARVLNGTNWSPIIEYTFFPRQDFSKLLVTEIMYNPPGVTNIDGDEYEFLELKNTGTVTLNLSGLRFTAGITFNFTNGTTLAPGAFFVLARNAAQFTARHPGVAINGIYTGRLDNAGETVRLSYALGNTVLSVSYDDAAPWPVTADGFGFTLVPKNPNANPDLDNPVNWRASTLPGGSPGADDPASPIITVLINEVLSHSETSIDYIELFNPNETAADIGGWFLTDDPSAPKKFRIPDGTTIQPLGYTVFDETQFNPTPGTNNSFSLNARGDQVHIFSADSNTNLTGYSHGFAFGAAADGDTFGRYVISTGEEQFPAQLAPTLSTPNAGPRVGPLVISEIMYHPSGVNPEFIEIRNITTNGVPLFDPAHATNAWRLNGVGFDFPPGFTLGSNAIVVITATNPAAFRAQFNVPAGVAVLGPYTGNLQDSGERLELQRPDVPDTNALAYITIDEVRFNDKAPWPAAADGSGPSLQRKNIFAYGNDPANWEAATATPGTDFTGGLAPTLLSQPQSRIVFRGESALFNVSVSGPLPIGVQWSFNGSPIAGATSTNLLLNNVQLAQAGSYSVVAFNNAGSVASAPAILTVLRVPTIFGNPTNQFVRPGSNAVFSVQASGNGILRYQWRFNGVTIPGATNVALVVTNSQLANEGEYSCVVTDSVGPATSLPARIFILITPVIVQPPVNQTVVAGGDVTFSVGITGNPAPFRYGWFRGSSPVAVVPFSDSRANFVTLNTTAAGFILASNMPSTNYTCRIVITNAAHLSPGINTTFVLTVLADSDGDGLPDVFEQTYFGGGVLADRNADTDGDGMLNWQEYLAGTDPTDSLSYLKIQTASTGSPAVVQFLAVSNRTYSVQYTDKLGGVPWINLGDTLARTTNRVESLADAGFTTNRFYRLVTPRQP